jgi:hypothetical protein
VGGRHFFPGVASFSLGELWRQDEEEAEEEAEEEEEEEEEEGGEEEEEEEEAEEEEEEGGEEALIPTATESQTRHASPALTSQGCKHW